MSNKQKAEMFKKIKQNYEGLRVGQSMYVVHSKSNSDRVIRVGNKFLYTMSRAKLTASDVIDWWMG